MKLIQWYLTENKQGLKIGHRRKHASKNCYVEFFWLKISIELVVFILLLSPFTFCFTVISLLSQQRIASIKIKSSWSTGLQHPFYFTHWIVVFYLGTIDIIFTFYRLCYNSVLYMNEVLLWGCELSYSGIILILSKSMSSSFKNKYKFS